MCINIWKQILWKYIFSSIANLKCTPSDRQMYPWGTCAPGWEPLVYFMVNTVHCRCKIIEKPP